MTELLIEQENHLTKKMIVHFINRIYKEEILPDDWECDTETGRITFMLPDEDYRYSLDFYFKVDIECGPRFNNQGDLVDSGEFSLINDYILLTDNVTEQNIRVEDTTKFLDLKYIHDFCQDKLYDNIFGDWDYDF